jgi:hypothetical protein
LGETDWWRLFPSKGWYWIPGGQKSRQALARQTVQAERQLAEDQEILYPRDSSALTTSAYVFASLFILELIFMIVALIVTIFFD